jgi:hypothetical protein
MVLGVKKWKYDCMEEPPLKQSLSSKSKPFHHQNHPKRSPTWAVHSIALRGPSLHPQHQKKQKKGKRKKEKENLKNAISVPKVQLFFISIPLELFVLSRDKPSTSHRSPLPSRMTSNTYKATLRIVHDIE